MNDNAKTSFSGIIIVGACIDEDFNMDLKVLKNVLMLENCHFSEAVSMQHLKTLHLISLNKSYFEKPLRMSGARIGGSLQLYEIQAPGIDLSGANIDGSIFLQGAKITDKLDISYSLIKENLDLYKGNFSDVAIIDSIVSKQVALAASNFHGEVNLNLLKAGSDVSLHLSDFSKRLMIQNSIINGSLFLYGTKLSDLNLDCTELKGALSFGVNHNPDTKEETFTKWYTGSQLSLRNFKARMVSFRKENYITMPELLPDRIDFTNFVYDDFVSEEALKSIKLEKAVELVSPFEKQTYSPQPYQQLATILKRDGQIQKSRKVLYLSMEKERKLSTGFQYLWLTVKKVVIGYGYYPLYSGIWLIGFVIIGAVIFRSSPEAKKNHMPYGVAYSLDMILPIIKLRESHYDIDLEGWQRYYFFFHKMMGYILASFLIASLSLLTSN